MAQGEVGNERQASLRAREVAVMADRECADASAALAETSAQIRNLRFQMVQDRDKSLSLEQEALRQRQDMSRRAPVWQADCECCMLGCGTKFGLLAWRHHCRCCGYVVCWDCLRGPMRLNRWISSKTRAVKYDALGQMKKVCRNCYTLTLEVGQ